LGGSFVNGYIKSPGYYGEFVRLKTAFNKSDSKEVIAIYRGRAKPDELVEVYINVSCVCGAETFYGSARFTASLDPGVSIDPDFLVKVNGVDLPANQLYEVVLSSNLYRSLPPLDLLLLD
jgi:hypothetical protein